MTDEIKSNEKIVSLPYLLTETQITVTAPDGSTKCMDRAHSNFETVLRAVRENRWEDVLREIDVKEIINDMEGFDVRNDRVYIRDRELPSALGAYLLKIIELKMDSAPVLAFWDNLVGTPGNPGNPSYRAVNELFGFLEANRHPLTEDGCFIGYKGVNSDWTDCHTGEIDNSIGATVHMDRSLVNEDPKQTCSRGLHIGNHEAAKRYWGGTGHLLVVKVNPRDVVAVPYDYHEAKMRVCEYTVLQETDRHLNDTPVYSSTEPDEVENEDDGDDDCSDNCPACGASCEANCVCGQNDTDDDDDEDDGDDWNANDEDDDDC